MNEPRVISASHEAGQGNLKSYTIGFIYSVVLTLAAFIGITTHRFSGWLAVSVILVLAVCQLIVQTVYFLHLGRDSSQRWNLVVFVFMLNIVVILVIGSIWIMQSLNYHHDNRSPSQLNNTIVHDEGYK